LEQGLKNKLRKLNEKYILKKQNWLAFFTQNHVYPWHYEEYLQALYSIQQSTEYKCKFDKVLICGSNCVVFDLKNNRIEIQQTVNENFFEKMQNAYSSR
jgi:hypothetical protein